MQRTTAWVVLILGALLMAGTLAGVVVAILDDGSVTTSPHALLLVLVGVGM